MRKNNIYLYCNEDPSKIEGFEKIKKYPKSYVCHHRRETRFEDGSYRPKAIPAEILKELGYYYNRPASELIIMTRAEHNTEHSNSHLKENNGMYGKHPQGYNYYLKHPELWSLSSRQAAKICNVAHTSILKWRKLIDKRSKT